jgi:hypothetical protein
MFSVSESIVGIAWIEGECATLFSLFPLVITPSYHLYPRRMAQQH